MNPDDVKILVSFRLQQSEECLNDARILQSMNTGNRTIVNRSYYAAFYSLLALLQSIGKIPRKHRGAITLFETEFIKKEILPKELSRLLHWLFNERNKDDYTIIEPVSAEDALKALKKADKFVEEVRLFLFNAGYINTPTNKRNNE